MRFEMPPPAKPWSTNQDRNLHHQQRAAVIKTWKEATWAHALLATAPEARRQPPGEVKVSIPFADHRRRDPHNYCGTVVKAVIDGLVHAGFWPDDTPEWVEHREPRLYKGTMVVVEITPREGETP